MQRDVEILDKREVFHRSVFRIEEARFRHRHYDGGMSKEITRLNLDRGDSVAALVHDTEQDCVILTEQFRYPTYEKGPGWLLEIPAGILEPDEDLQESMNREVLEEIGYTPSLIRSIVTVYASPGGSSERIHIFYVPVTQACRFSDGGGVASEGEDIRIVTLPAIKAFEKLTKGEFVDAKTIIALQWLKLEQCVKD